MAFFLGDQNDQLLTGGIEDDVIEGGGGNDTLFGGGGDDSITGFAYGYGGTTEIDAGAGNDEIVLSDLGNSTVDGGSGNDLLSIYASSVTSNPVRLILTQPSGLAELAGGVTISYSSIERIRILTGIGNDTITGGDLDDSINVFSGDDLVDAGAGNDEVSYIIDGQATLEGGLGQDHLSALVSGRTGYFVVDLLAGTVDDGQLAQISGFERYSLRGNFADDFAALGNGNDLFFGQSGDDTVFGRDGMDLLFGGRGADVLHGDDGHDWLRGEQDGDLLTGGLGNDYLFGGFGSDTLDGGAGNDHLQGGRGADEVDGGIGNDRIYSSDQGNDTLTGGDGADRFIFRETQWANHLITDFASGLDRLAFLGGALTATGLSAGALSASQLTVATATGPQGQFVLRYDALLDESQLVWDNNGDNPAGGVTAVVRFSGAVALNYTDILIL